MKNVRDVMAADVESVSAETPVDEVARIMAKADVGSVPVVQDENLLGVVTDRDLVVRVLAAGRDPGSVTAGDAASTDVVSVSPDQSIDDVRRLMAENQVRRLPVVEDGRLVGMLSIGDIAVQDSADSETGEALESISRSADTASGNSG